MLCKARKSVIEFFDDYTSVIPEAKLKATKIKGLKILTPKQMLQRLPITLAQVKADNKAESSDQANCLFFVSIKRQP